MTHHVFEVSADEKTAVVRALASGTGRRILFMRTKHHAKKLAKQLTDAGIPSVDLHGNLSQPQRDRNLAAFSAGDAKVLVATDVAARGVHVDNVELVVHVDPPMEHKAYLHRSGRTARAGSQGDVVTVMMPSQRKDTEALLRKAAIAVTPQSVTATSPALIKLVGDVAAYVKPAPRVEQQQGGGGRSQGANAQRKRAARDGQPHRSDRSGRPAKSGTQAKAQTPNRGGAAARSYSSSSASAAPASSESRRSSGSRRAGSPAGKAAITVGTVVRSNTRGR
jgi:superfamily II DNA/RNA helicase